MKKSISTEQKTSSDVVRDRKGQTAAVAIIATVLALTFTAMDFRDPNAPQEHKHRAATLVGRINRATLDNTRTPTTQQQSLEKFEEPSPASDTTSSVRNQNNTDVQNVSTAQQTVTDPIVSQQSDQSQSSTTEAVSENEHETQTIDEDSSSNEQIADSDRDRNESQTSNVTQSITNERSQETQRSSQRVTAAEMNRSSRVNNWDGDKEVKELKSAKEWNNEDEVEEIKIR